MNYVNDIINFIWFYYYIISGLILHTVFVILSATVLVQMLLLLSKERGFLYIKYENDKRLYSYASKRYATTHMFCLYLKLRGLLCNSYAINSEREVSFVEIEKMAKLGFLERSMFLLVGSGNSKGMHNTININMCMLLIAYILFFNISVFSALLWPLLILLSIVDSKKPVFFIKTNLQ